MTFFFFFRFVHEVVFISFFFFFFITPMFPESGQLVKMYISKQASSIKHCYKAARKQFNNVDSDAMLLQRGH